MSYRGRHRIYRDAANTMAIQWLNVLATRTNSVQWSNYTRFWVGGQSSGSENVNDLSLLTGAVTGPCTNANDVAVATTNIDPVGEVVGVGARPGDPQEDMDAT